MMTGENARRGKMSHRFPVPNAAPLPCMEVPDCRTWWPSPFSFSEERPSYVARCLQIHTLSRKNYDWKCNTFIQTERTRHVSFPTGAGATKTSNPLNPALTTHPTRAHPGATSLSVCKARTPRPTRWTWAASFPPELDHDPDPSQTRTEPKQRSPNAMRGGSAATSCSLGRSAWPAPGLRSGVLRHKIVATQEGKGGTRGWVHRGPGEFIFHNGFSTTYTHVLDMFCYLILIHSLFIIIINFFIYVWPLILFKILIQICKIISYI
jgi:hypothetical protein